MSRIERIDAEIMFQKEDPLEYPTARSVKSAFYRFSIRKQGWHREICLKIESSQ